MAPQKMNCFWAAQALKPAGLMYIPTLPRPCRDINTSIRLQRLRPRPPTTRRLSRGLNLPTYLTILTLGTDGPNRPMGLPLLIVPRYRLLSHLHPITRLPILPPRQCPSAIRPTQVITDMIAMHRLMGHHPYHNHLTSRLATLLLPHTKHNSPR